ncbi:ABC transporter ATP-binding protein [Puniceicoccus vermicola]|uniref:ABC transporter ATP-binding protein n=1 Tax=Puniceicoccus vermicola TaxID=388746 RepID=A0A7X1AY61_9BACT|nr:ABC transporter ATP-binding protein [Puniceicoccus vermicola]MBC2601944.1 ABC transporter ATP-binding protein [Puniceicoccus vermicola]
MTASPDTRPALRIEDLSVSYLGGRNAGQPKETTALSSFSAEVLPGEVFALVGESGSGKSTAGFAVGGLLPPENTRVAGKVTVGGKTIPAKDYAALQKLCGRHIGFVFQEPSSALHPSIKIETQIGESLHGKLSSRQRKERVASLLQSVRLTPDKRLLKAYPHHLSGGMQQRVVLAIAMANRPSVLIADEPTTALDPTIRKEVLQLIRDLATDSRSGVLLITHDFGIVSHFADRVAVLYHGEVVESGVTRNVLSSPQHSYTKSLIASARGTTEELA